MRVALYDKSGTQSGIMEKNLAFVAHFTLSFRKAHTSNYIISFFIVLPQYITYDYFEISPQTYSCITVLHILKRSIKASSLALRSGDALASVQVVLSASHGVATCDARPSIVMNFSSESKAVTSFLNKENKKRKVIPVTGR
jgi:hypothetical protein